MSTDNTAAEPDAMKIGHLDLPFNMGYAGALQAGLKFASINNHDFADQFDKKYNGSNKNC